MKTYGIGVIGCGNISTAYFRLAPMFKGLQMRACADLNMAAAEAQAKEFGLRASTVEDLLAADDIDIIVNLTIPAAHFEVTKRILEAGKHAYSEKPFVLTLEEGAVGGYGAFVLQHLAEVGALDNGLKIRTLHLPDVFQDQDKPYEMYEAAGLNARHIAARAIEALGRGNVQELDNLVRA